MEPHNTVVQLKAFGGPEQVVVAEAPMPTAGPGEVRVRVLASSIQFTDTVIRRHRYPQLHQKPPFVLGYDVIGEVDQVGTGVKALKPGDRVADLTVIGSNASYRTLRATDATRVPPGADPAEAATLVLSWMTAYQLLHRAAKVKPGQRALVLGAAGAVGQALLVLGKRAGLELFGTAREAKLSIVRELGATPIGADSPLPRDIDVVFDGLAEQGFRRGFDAVKRGGLLCAFGFTQALERPAWVVPAWIARLYLWNVLPYGKRATFYSIGAMRAAHPDWFHEDLAKLFELLMSDAIHPRVAQRISFAEVARAHQALDAGTLTGKVVLCPC